ncbi:MAG TPA: POTRA domain-containing protein [Pyrinomonadaceae bacterium]|nr:POTRA domain-containing protein [Pyrinomonadaceae bacterium]
MIVLTLLISLFIYLPSQSNFAQGTKDPAVKLDAYSASCAQPTDVKARLMRKAEENQYTIRRIEFVGNKNTQDQVLRDRTKSLQEGDVFTRENLIRSLKSVSQLETIRPVTLSDMAVRLGKPTKEIDVIICFNEKQR